MINKTCILLVPNRSSRALIRIALLTGTTRSTNVITDTIVCKNIMLIHSINYKKSPLYSLLHNFKLLYCYPDYYFLQKCATAINNTAEIVLATSILEKNK